jgi:hypothetical protein
VDALGVAMSTALASNWKQRGSSAARCRFAWQQVEEEAAQELVDRQSQKALLVGMCGVTPAKRDVALLNTR